MMRPIQKLFSAARRYARERRGAAAAEFALVVTLLIVPILNVMDLGLYAWDKVQVDNAAQIGAQGARAACTYSFQPATVNCPGLSSAVQMAVHSTSLGTGVTSTTAEHYVCYVSGQLKIVSDPPATPPTDCSQQDSNGNNIGGSNTEKPGDYILVTTSYTYAPIFSAVSIASVLNTPITSTSWIRIG
jgi:Flp pilus assembly protein TadG